MLQYFINALTILSVGSALVFFLWTAKHSKLLNIFGAYLVLCAIFELIPEVISPSWNIPFFHIFTFFEFLILSYFFTKLLNLRRFYFIIFTMIALIFAIYIILVESIFLYIIWPKSISDSIFILLATISLFRLITTETNINSYIKYFIYGLLLSFGGSFSVYLFLEILINFSTENQENIWMINVMLKIIAQSLYIWGLIVFRTKSKRVVGGV